MKKELFSTLLLACMLVTSASANNSNNDIQSALAEDISASTSVSSWKNALSSVTIEQIQYDFLDSYAKEENNTSRYQDLQPIMDKAYKAYFLNNEDFISAATSEPNLAENISDEYTINIPLQNGFGEIVGVATLYNIDGQFELGSYGKATPAQMALFNADTTETMAFANDLFNTTDNNIAFKVVMLNKYDTLALYVNTNNVEYMLPMSTNEDITNLNENELYTANNFVETLEENNQETQVSTMSNIPEYGLGSEHVTKTEATNHMMLYYIAGGIILIVLLGTVLTKIKAK